MNRNLVGSILGKSFIKFAYLVLLMPPILNIFITLLKKIEVHGLKESSYPYVTRAFN
jgi:hypothetical protein